MLNTSKPTPRINVLWIDGIKKSSLHKIWTLCSRVTCYFLIVLLTLLNSRLSFSLGTEKFNKQSENCGACHGDIIKKWRISHHAYSIQKANLSTVLADFNNVKAQHYGQEAYFTRKHDQFFAHVSYKKNNKITQKKTYPILYTFGFKPLQQYLVETKGGRLQVLPFAWDSRTEEQGGQKWMHLYPDEEIAPNDRFHWLQPLQNWNGMCADCHSDGFKRNYNLDSKEFMSQYDELNVSCTSCHDNLNNNHSRKVTKDKTSYKGDWIRSKNSDTARWQGTPRKNNMDMCYSCHALRTPITDGFSSEKSFLDQFSPSFPSPPLYYADGQIREEVYVFGSFLQSKMHRAGVTCLDCHDAHTYEIKKEGNALCLQCHSASTFDTNNHHKQNSDGAQCVNCHMPSKIYMNVDQRRDHSFRIPEPMLSKEFGVPNACQSCHKAQGEDWILEKSRQLFPNKERLNTNVLTFIATMGGFSHDLEKLLTVARSNELVPIKRAALIERIPSLTLTLEGKKLSAFLSSSNAFIRLAAVRASSVLHPSDKRHYLAPLLTDKFRSIRVATAEQLLDVLLPADQLIAFENAFVELSEAAQQSHWRGEGLMNDGLRYARMQEIDKAINSYSNAIEIDPYFEPPYVNLSDLYRSIGQPEKSEEIYKKGLSNLPTSALLNYSFGLYWIRRKQLEKAIVRLKTAVDLAPQNSQFAYMYYLSLFTADNKSYAFCDLNKNLKNYGDDQNLVELLRSFSTSYKSSLKECNN